MGEDSPQPEIVLILRMLDQAYVKKSWHGPNLRGSLRRISAAQAVWRPPPGRKSIADHVVHAAYWKYAVRRRFTGEERGSFPLKGSNWFPLPEALDEKTWRGYVVLLDREHRALREAITRLTDAELHVKPANSKVSNVVLLTGIAAHDLYHTGQIQLLKRLYRSETV